MNTKFMHPAEQIVMLMNRVYKSKLTTTSGGNFSIKDDEGNIWITPSGIDKGSLTPADICKISPDGTVTGKYAPSCELPFHKMAYEARPDVKAVMHAHPVALVSFSLAREIPEVNVVPTPYSVCGKVGDAGYEVPGSIELGKRIISVLEKGCDVAMMSNHGVTVVAEDLFEAYKKFETYNTAAKILIQAKKIGKPVVLTERQLKLYAAAKFDMAEFEPQTRSAEEMTLRKQICAFSKRSLEQGIFSAIRGVIAARLGEDSFLVSPHYADRAYLEPEDIVRVDGGKREKGKEPAHAAETCREIFKKHPEINAVFFAEPEHIMAYSVTHTPIDSRTIPESYIQMRTVKNLPYGITINNPAKLADTICSSTPVVIVENDCVISAGHTITNAFDRMEVAEFTANTIINAMPIGETIKITDEEVEVINKAFNLK